MSTVPHYRDQPATLDPSHPIPEDKETVPLAQGHTPEQAEEVAAASTEFKEVVEAEADAAREAEEANAEHHNEQTAAWQQDPAAERAPEGTIDDTMAWVGNDPERAQIALDQENAKPSPRSSLVTRLEAIVAG